MPGLQLDLLDLDHLLTLARLGRLLLLKEAKLAEIEDLADRRGRVGNDFDQIERRFVSELLRVCKVDDAAILAFGVDKLDLDCADVAIGARPAFLRRRGCLHWTTNGHSPLVRADGARSGAHKTPAQSLKPCGQLEMG